MKRAFWIMWMLGLVCLLAPILQPPRAILPNPLAVTAVAIIAGVAICLPGSVKCSLRDWKVVNGVALILLIGHCLMLDSLWCNVLLSWNISGIVVDYVSLSEVVIASFVALALFVSHCCMPDG